MLVPRDLHLRRNIRRIKKVRHLVVERKPHLLAEGHECIEAPRFYIDETDFVPLGEVLLGLFDRLGIWANGPELYEENVILYPGWANLIHKRRNDARLLHDPFRHFWGEENLAPNTDRDISGLGICSISNVDALDLSLSVRAKSFSARRWVTSNQSGRAVLNCGNRLHGQLASQRPQSLCLLIQ